MVRKIFKKPKDSINKTKLTKPKGRKRKIFTTIALGLSLLFGKSRSVSFQSSSPNFDNQTIHGKVISNRNFNFFEYKDRQIILVKGYRSGNPSNVPSNIGSHGQSPSNFPTPPAGGRPSRPVYVPKHRTVPRVIDPVLGASGNPGGAGGAAEFDSQCAILEYE